MSDTGLTTAETNDKAALMTRVRNGLDTWVEVGTALMELRDRKLWRDEAPDFTSFCQTHFGFTRRRADQLIAASAAVLEVTHNAPHVVDNAGFGTIVPSAPANEAQAREVAKAPVGKRAETFRKAAETAPKDKDGKPKVTAAHVRRVVREEESKPDAAPDAPVADPMKPWEQVVARTESIVTSLNAVAADMADAYGAVDLSKTEHELRHPAAKGYSWSGTVGAVKGIISYLRDYLPVGEDAKGVITARRQKEIDAFNNRRAS